MIQCNRIAGVAIFQFQRRSLCQNSALVQNDHMVCIGSLLHVVGGEKYRHVLFLSQFPDHPPDRFSSLRIQPCGGFVQNQQLRLVKNRPCNVDSPPLSAGELPHASFQQKLQLQQFVQFYQTFLKCPAGNAVECRTDFQVVQHRKLFIQHGMLEHHAKALPDLRHVLQCILSLNPHAAGILPQLSAQHGNGRAFSCPVDAQKRKQFPLFHLQGQVVHRVHSSEAFL